MSTGAQSPAKEQADPMVGKAGGDVTDAPSQKTGAEQRPGVSGNTDGGHEAGGGGITSEAVNTAKASVAAVEGEVGGQSRHEVETSSKAQ